MHNRISNGIPGLGVPNSGCFVTIGREYHLAVGAETGGIKTFITLHRLSDGHTGLSVPDAFFPRGRDYPLAVGAEIGRIDIIIMLHRQADGHEASASKMRAVLSSDAVTTLLPSGLKRANRTYLSCFIGSQTIRPVSMSQ